MKTRTEKIKAGEIKLIKIPWNMRGKLTEVDFGDVDISEPVWREELPEVEEPVIKVEVDAVLEVRKKTGRGSAQAKRSTGDRYWYIGTNKIHSVKCRKCGDLISTDLAVKNDKKLGGVELVCGECHRQQSLKWANTGGSQRRRERLRNRTQSEVLADQKRLRWDGMKKCRTCGEMKNITEFTRDLIQSDGLRISCALCCVKKETERRSRAVLQHWVEVGIPFVCFYCGNEYVHIEHVKALALGGGDTPECKVPACQRCNLTKSNLPLKEWWDREERSMTYNELTGKLERYGIIYE